MELTYEQKVERLWDIQQIKNLMGKYAYCHNAHLHMKTVEMFALEKEDIWVECVGIGVYCGADGIKNFFYDWHMSLEGDMKGAFNEHLLTTEVIEVAGDGKTAKAVWMSPGAETRRYKPKNELEAIWIWGKYAIDFIKADGEWKFWHFTITNDILCDYHHSWVEIGNATDENVVNNGMPKPHKPNTFKPGFYNKESITALYPVPPEPYDTYE